MQKTAFQKMIEKALMLERNTRLAVVPVEDETGYIVMVIGLNTETGFTPLAKLLSKVDIDAMMPRFDKFEPIEEILQRARSEMPGVKPAEYEELPAYEYLSRTSIDELDFD